MPLPKVEACRKNQSERSSVDCAIIKSDPDIDPVDDTITERQTLTGRTNFPSLFRNSNPKGSTAEGKCDPKELDPPRKTEGAESRKDG